MGGSTNLTEIAACTTRLRLIVADPARVDEPALKRLGARGILRPSPSGVQVVLGPVADTVAMEMRAAIESGPIAATRHAAPASDAPATVTSATPSGSGTAALPDAVVKALGGTGNIAAASHHAGRWRIVLVDPARAGEVPLDRVRATVRVADDTFHVLTD
ncbi:phosphotransferase system IIB component [Sphingomonas sanguinis]